MSSLIIEVCQIDDVLPHSGADRLQLATIKGWQCVIKTNEFSKGQKVIYVPPDAIIPTEVAKKFDKEAYLGSGGRVKVVKLRGETSFGLILPCENDKWPLSKDVADIYGITKYVPQVRMVGGKNSSKTNAAPKHPLWQRYTEIEHLRNYPDIIPVGQEVVCLEKIHGCFKDNTPVLMSDGSYKPISKVKQGDTVISYNNGEFTPQKVLNNFNSGKSNLISWMKIHLDNGKEIICTSNHKFLTKNGWVEAQFLTEIDDLIEY